MMQVPDVISTDKAPAAVGPYSQAIRVGDLLFVSGQLPIDPATGTFSSEDPVEQCASAGSMSQRSRRLLEPT